MRRAPSHLSISALIAILAFAGAHAGCLVRTGKPVLRPGILKTASLAELTAKLEALDEIKTTRSTVRLQLSVVSEDRTEINEYTEAGGIILIQKPEFIRVRAEFPVVGSTVFDMTSDGTEYKVHLPTENRFLIGRNEYTTPSKKRLDNVRPQHIRAALVIDPPLEEEEVAFMRNVTYGAQSYHVVSIEKKGEQRLSREIWFDRIALQIVRQTIYEPGGDPVTDAWYQQWVETESVPFPGLIRIDRPKDGYALRVEVLKSGINADVPAKAFVLDTPEGVKIERIGAPSEEEPEAAQ
jgi:outer membrane lipoprotein-sorting protein